MFDVCGAYSSQYPAIVPVTVLPAVQREGTKVPYHPIYSGKVLFQNTFDGKLPAADYPKVKVRRIFYPRSIRYPQVRIQSSIFLCSLRMPFLGLHGAGYATRMSMIFFRSSTIYPV
jgi:hypothetical protein